MPGNRSERAREFLRLGGAVAGNIATTAVGLLAAPDPATGALAAAASSPLVVEVFTATCDRIYDAVTGERGRVRGGAAAAFALVAINARLTAGDNLRGDDFFDGSTGRSKAEEILEGVVVKARDEHEERKTRFYANILANGAFAADASASDLNYFLALAERLTYGQLCVLSLFGRGGYVLSDQNWSESSDEELGTARLTLLARTFDLHRLELIYCRQPSSESNAALFGSTEIRPAWMHLSTIGKRLHDLMGLSGIPESDLEDIVSLFRPIFIVEERPQ